jgi:hypothetical protein
MKKTIAVSIWLTAWLLGCTEIPPVISPLMDKPGDSIDTVDPGDQYRVVLIEEFSGVRCVNCPAGSAAIKSLRALHKGRVAVLSIHAGFFARKYPESQYDFRTPEGDRLLSFLGEPLGYPTAVINRRHFPNETGLQLGQAKWAGYVADELRAAPKVGISCEKNYDPSTRQLRLMARVEILEDLPSPAELRLSVAITEDGIVDHQLTPAGQKADYVHDHVLRYMLSNFDGNPLSGDLNAGTSVSRSYSLVLPPVWNADNCRLVVFAHYGAERKEVLQAWEEALAR